MHQLMNWVDQYGYLILFLSLCLELIAFPIPTELLMAYVGFLSYQHHMNVYLSVAVAASGSFLGTVVAYWLGNKLGYPFFHRYGRYFHLGPERLDRTSEIFNKHGSKFLLVSYFIPGVRHITGYFSGISRIRFRHFGISAAIGASLWTATFIVLGDILGPKYKLIETSTKKYLLIFVIFLVVFGIAFYLIKMNLDKIKQTVLASVQTINATYRSRRGLKILITTATAVFILFLSVSIGLIQDIVSKDVSTFNKIVLIIADAVFQKGWGQAMDAFLWPTTYSGLAIIAGLTVIWIVWNGKNRMLEFQLWILLYAGGEMYVKALRWMFEEVAAGFHISLVLAPDFGNDRLILVVMAFGFFAFLFSRHVSSHILKIIATLFVLAVLLTAGIGLLYFDLQLPSDIAACYVFGGVWLSFVVMLLEILRLVRLNADNKRNPSTIL